MDNNEILLKTLQKENELIKQNCKKMKEEQQRKNQEFELKMKEEKEKNLREKEQLLEEQKEIQQKLDSILYSRSYRAMEKIKKIIGR